MQLSNNKVTIIVVISVLILAIVILGAFWLTSQQIIKVDADKIERIEIFCGYTGELITITDDYQIKRIIDNLNSVTFKKDSLVGDRDGFNFDVNVFGKKSDLLKTFIIDSKDQIRYNGYFYVTKDSEIDFDYIKNLFKQ